MLSHSLAATGRIICVSVSVVHKEWIDAVYVALVTDPYGLLIAVVGQWCRVSRASSAEYLKRKPISTTCMLKLSLVDNNHRVMLNSLQKGNTDQEHKYVYQHSISSSSVHSKRTLHSNVRLQYSEHRHFQVNSFWKFTPGLDIAKNSQPIV